MRKNAGFTLIEIAVVLVIVGLLLGGLLMPLTMQIEQRNITDSNRAMEAARDAMIGFAMRNTPPFLPCPDKTGAAGPGTANDGIEDRNGAACVTQEGNVPWVTLGTSPEDGWTRRLRYRVTAAYSNSGGFTLASAGDITIQTRNGAGQPLVNLAQNVPLVIISHGPNGLGGIGNSGVAMPPPASADEIENADGDTTFVSRLPTADFDDLAQWVSANTLFNRMVAAGRLP